MAQFIVVVDGSPTTRKILETALSREGYQVESFSDPRPLLQALFSSEVHVPDLLFVELTLPNMGGFEVIRRVREREEFARVPVFIVSRRYGLLARLRAWWLGVNEYVAKPLKVQGVIALVRRYLPPGPAAE